MMCEVIIVLDSVLFRFGSCNTHQLVPQPLPMPLLLKWPQSRLQSCAASSCSAALAMVLMALETRTITLRFLSRNAVSLPSRFVGVGARRVRTLFQAAKKKVNSLILCHHMPSESSLIDSSYDGAFCCQADSETSTALPTSFSNIALPKGNVAVCVNGTH